jgi:hypothetical protein
MLAELRGLWLWRLGVLAHRALHALAAYRLTPDESRDSSHHQGGHNLPAAASLDDRGSEDAGPVGHIGMATRMPPEPAPARLLSGRTRGRSSAGSGSSSSSDVAGSGILLPSMPAVATPHAAALDLADFGLRSPRPPGAA